MSCFYILHRLLVLCHGQGQHLRYYYDCCELGALDFFLQIQEILTSVDISFCLFVFKGCPEKKIFKWFSLCSDMCKEVMQRCSVRLCSDQGGQVLQSLLLFDKLCRSWIEIESCICPYTLTFQNRSKFHFICLEKCATVFCTSLVMVCVL